MLKIRLARNGARNNPFYRIAVVEGSKKLSGRAIEVLGYWHPGTKLLNVDKKKIDVWVKKGAHLTNSLKVLIK